MKIFEVRLPLYIKKVIRGKENNLERTPGKRIVECHKPSRDTICSHCKEKGQYYRVMTHTRSKVRSKVRSNLGQGCR